MHRVNEYRFYELGQKIWAIHGFEQSTPYKDAIWPLWEARIALTNLQDDVVALRISVAAVERVIQAIDAIVQGMSKTQWRRPCRLRTLRRPLGGHTTIWPSPTNINAVEFEQLEIVLL